MPIYKGGPISTRNRKRKNFSTILEKNDAKIHSDSTLTIDFKESGNNLLLLKCSSSKISMCKQ